MLGITEENVTAMFPLVDQQTINSHQQLINTSYDFSNLTGCPQDVRTGKFELMSLIFGIFIGLFNLIVILAVAIGGKKLRKVTFYCICNLAVADMAAGLLLLWNFSMQKTLMKTRTPKSELAQKLFWSTTIWASMLSQVVIAMDRYCYVTKGLAGNGSHWGSSKRKRWIKFGILMTWLIPITTLVVPVSAGWNCIENCFCNVTSPGVYSMVCTPIEKCSLTNPAFTKGSMLYMGVTLIVLPIVPCVLYFKIYSYVSKSTRKLNRSMATRAAVEAVVQATQIVGPKRESDENGRQNKNYKGSQGGGDGRLAFAWLPDIPKIFRKASMSDGQQNCNRNRRSASTTSAVNAMAQRRLMAQEGGGGDTMRSKPSIVSTNSNYASSMKRRARDLRLLRTLILILVLFMISALPLGGLFIMTYSETNKDLLKTTKYIIALSLINSLVNPWIYFWRFPEMRAAVQCAYIRRYRSSYVATRSARANGGATSKMLPPNRNMSSQPRLQRVEKTSYCSGVKVNDQSGGTKDSYSSSIGL